MRHVFAAALFTLIPLNAYAAAGNVPAGAVVISSDPDGEGDPNAWTCRKPIQHVGPGIQRLGPMVCQTNQFWADLIKNHQRVDETGAVVPIKGKFGEAHDDPNADQIWQYAQGR